MLPQGFEPQFRFLCAAARPASLTVERKWARATPMQVGMLAWQRSREQEDNANTQKSVELQMLYAGAQAPKKARSRLAQMVFSTATARQDAENAERIKWIACLSQLVAGTATPLGQRLVQRPAEVASMGLGLRAGTLRNRAHVLRLCFLLSQFSPFVVPLAAGSTNGTTSQSAPLASCRQPVQLQTRRPS